jgi:hypothetical protein
MDAKKGKKKYLISSLVLFLDVLLVNIEMLLLEKVGHHHHWNMFFEEFGWDCMVRRVSRERETTLCSHAQAFSKKFTFTA